MAIFPKATRTSFARLLRKRGYALPRNRELMFSNVGHSFFLMWDGPDGEPHRAYYTGVAGCPMLVVDQDTVRRRNRQWVRRRRLGSKELKNGTPHSCYFSDENAVCHLF